LPLPYSSPAEWACPAESQDERPEQGRSDSAEHQLLRLLLLLLLLLLSLLLLRLSLLLLLLLPERRLLRHL
jgi:hypothetical protein